MHALQHKLAACMHGCTAEGTYQPGDRALDVAGDQSGDVARGVGDLQYPGLQPGQRLASGTAARHELPGGEVPCITGADGLMAFRAS